MEERPNNEERQTEGNTGKDSTRRGNGILFRLAVGSYLIYLAWTMFGKRETVPEGSKTLYSIFIVLFAAAGLFITIHSIVIILREEKEKKQAAVSQPPAFDTVSASMMDSAATEQDMDLAADTEKDLDSDGSEE